MLKAMAMLGVLAALGGGTYVAVNCTDCGADASAAAPVEVVSGEACTSCCPVEGAAAVAEACPLEGKTEDSTNNVTASATPAPAEQAAPQAN